MFAVTSSEGQARSGVLTTPGGAITTPAFLIYTHRGGALNLTSDLLEKLKPEAQAVQVDVLQYLTQPKPDVLRRFQGSGRQFLALDQRYVLVASSRDPAVYEYAGALRQATTEFATVTNQTGSTTVSPAQYMEAVAAIAPDLYVALSDDIPCDSRQDRAAKSVDRTAAWLADCLAAAAAAPELACAAAFAAVQGAQFLRERIRCAEAVAKQAGVAGYVLGGLGTGESPELRQQIIAAVLERLPAGAPRLLSSVGTPEEVLEAVGQGVDLFDMAYVADVTASGYALSFPCTQQEEEAEQRQQQGQQGAAAEAADRGEDGSKINLWALAYRTDKRPLLPACSCFTCTNHTRAYLHHLLQAHEMTAQVLLEMHNTHHYLRFFAAIRASIAAGGYGAYRAWFLERHQRKLVGEV